MASRTVGGHGSLTRTADCALRSLSATAMSSGTGRAAPVRQLATVPVSIPPPLPLRRSFTHPVDTGGELVGLGP